MGWTFYQKLTEVGEPSRFMWSALLEIKKRQGTSPANSYKWQTISQSQTKPKKQKRTTKRICDQALILFNQKWIEQGAKKILPKVLSCGCNSKWEWMDLSLRYHTPNRWQIDANYYSKDKNASSQNYFLWLITSMPKPVLIQWLPGITSNLMVLIPSISDIKEARHWSQEYKYSCFPHGDCISVLVVFRTRYVYHIFDISISTKIKDKVTNTLYSRNKKTHATAVQNKANWLNMD